MFAVHLCPQSICLLDGINGTKKQMRLDVNLQTTRSGHLSLNRCSYMCGGNASHVKRAVNEGDVTMFTH